MKKRITLPIGRIRVENRDVKTYTFYHSLEAVPGQFVMITDFEGGEKPISLSDCKTDEFSITVKRVGDFTDRLFNCRVGDIVSIRGAFGSSFFMSPEKPLLIGGGYGTPPLLNLSRTLVEKGIPVRMINAARTAEDLLLSEEFKALGVEYLETTDDGSRGWKGNAVEAVKRLKTEGLYNHEFVYAAGPEMMMFYLKPEIQEQNYQFLFERYMKCAIGICGSCAMDGSGIRICKEGPALMKDQVEKLKEFGVHHRDASGHKMKY